MATNLDESIKVFIPRAQSYIHQVKVPKLFISSIGGLIPKNIILRDSNKNSWSIKLVKLGNEFYFQDGWAKFVQDNSVAPQDLLSCEFKSGNLFHFDLFGFLKETGLPEVVNLDDNEETKKLNENNSEVTMEGDANDEGKCRVDSFGYDIFNFGKVVRSGNYHFVTKFQSSRPTDLFVPMNVLRNTDFKLPENPFIIDPEGRKWRIKLMKWKNGRILYKGGGWYDLCKRNHISEDDDCICEFVQGKWGFNVHVHIVRKDKGVGSEKN